MSSPIPVTPTSPNPHKPGSEDFHNFEIAKVLAKPIPPMDEAKKARLRRLLTDPASQRAA
ncbi:hypothetical protein [Auraticoccus monumenti]|uniref:Uncharacterized protein n=1 Tax=Auraticoccus monumenti TaxID=675864 RepID=A0A1G6UQD8_9ACTN|nr:hypothetical protein [Auraticoccus monumenti]SDD43493.1 hypothetical protein SAMN04489747_0941 [Auraticoccus monumenti]